MIKPEDIRRLELARFTMPAGSRWEGQQTVVCAYLIRHPKGITLFDTGFGTGHTKTEQEFGPIHRRSLSSALASLGLRISDISTVANCHAHLDHCGNNPLFPGIPIFIQQDELDALASLDYVIPELIDFSGAKLAVHDGEAEIAPGVRIIPTAGHTPGHQSLLIDTSKGRILLAGQAFNFASDYARARFTFAKDPERLPENFGWLPELERRDIRMALFAHDLLAWDKDLAARGHP